MAAALWESGGGEEFSPSATVVPFDQPVPLLRGPVPAGPEDDPSVGPFVLAFRDAASWRSALEATRSKLIEQCELIIVLSWKLVHNVPLRRSIIFEIPGRKSNDKPVFGKGGYFANNWTYLSADDVLSEKKLVFFVVFVGYLGTYGL